VLEKKPLLHDMEAGGEKGAVVEEKEVSRSGLAMSLFVLIISIPALIGA